MISRERGDEEERVGLLLGPADPAAQLVQVGQSEPVGAVDDDGVDVGHVEAGLDDGGREQDLVLAGREVDVDVGELVAGHLAVGDGEPDAGQQALDPLGDREDRLDLVVDEEDLAAAADLAVDVVVDQAVGPRRDLGGDFHPARRRRVNLRDVAQAGERHVERARYRRGGQGQYVDRRAGRADALLLPDPELLFLVEDQQPEVAELDARAQQQVGADDDVDHAGLQAVHDLRFCRAGDVKRESISMRNGNRASRLLNVE